MRKFKHKTLGWIATLSIEKLSAYRVVDVLDNFICTLPEELITQDREEVIEQPPQRMRDVIEEYNKNYSHLNDHKLIQALEKHAPKQVKFTRDELDYLKSLATLNDT